MQLSIDSDSVISQFNVMRRWMLGTDVLMLLYWLITGLTALGFVNLPEQYLFKDYHDSRVVAWNWSFFPLDLALALTGIYAAWLFKKADQRWFAYSLCSAALTFCAGLMAISYWALLSEFDLSWWLPNLLLVLWPLWFVPRLISASTN